MENNSLLSGDRQKRTKFLQSYQVDGEVKAIETFKNEFNDKCFMYVTLKGEIGLKDIRSKTAALTLNIGKERGLISSLILRNPSIS